MDNKNYDVRLPHPIFRTEQEYPSGLKTQKGAFESSHDAVIPIMHSDTQELITVGKVFIAEDGHGYLLVTQEGAESEPRLLDEDWFVYAYAAQLKFDPDNPNIITGGVVQGGYLAPYPAMWKE